MTAAPARIRTPGRSVHVRRAERVLAWLTDARADEARAKRMLDDLGAPPAPRKRVPGAPAKLDQLSALMWRLEAAKAEPADRARRTTLREVARLLAESQRRCWDAALAYDKITLRAAKVWSCSRGSHDDEHQVARQGAYEAAKRFRPEKRVLFSTYARWWVRAKLMRELPGHELSGHEAERIRNLHKAEREGLNEEQIAVRLGCEVEDLAKIREYEVRARPMSLDAPITDREGSVSLLEELCVPEAEPLTDLADVERAARALGHIEPRHQHVLRLRFGLGCDPHTLQQIAHAIGLSRERVRQLEREALLALRVEFGTVSPEAEAEDRAERYRQRERYRAAERAARRAR